MTRLGGWLFRHRTIIPIPLAIAVLALPPGSTSSSNLLIGLGIAVTALGEAIRLWAVHHIGTVSRTRSDRLGPLVVTGPFAVVRNPLYLGNIALWVGFAIAARLVWLVPIIVVLLAVEYHAIVRWEEELLEERYGGDYRSYLARVPRWMPRARPSTSSGRASSATAPLSGRARPVSPPLSGRARSVSPPLMVSLSNHEREVTRFSWRDTLFSERGTLMAIAVGYAALWIKARF